MRAPGGEQADSVRLVSLHRLVTGQSAISRSPSLRLWRALRDQPSAMIESAVGTAADSLSVGVGITVALRPAGTESRRARNISSSSFRNRSSKGAVVRAPGGEQADRVRLVSLHGLVTGQSAVSRVSLRDPSASPWDDDR